MNVAMSDRSRRLAAVLVSVLAVAGLMGSALAGLRWHELRESADSRKEVASQARELAVKITAYDYRDIDEYFAGIAEVSTGEFAEKLESASPDLREVVVSTKSVVTATVTHAGVQSLNDNEAVVLLFVDQEVINRALREPRIDRNRMLMTLEVDGDGRWRISALDLV